MKFYKLSLKDAWQIEPNLFEDSRGTFRRSFCQEKYEEYGIDSDMSQGNISENIPLLSSNKFGSICHASFKDNLENFIRFLRFQDLLAMV